MDNRFKPIGGMFQGVRGSVAKSTGADDAKKLLILNDDGKVDLSALYDNIKNAGELSNRLNDEIDARTLQDNIHTTEIESIKDRMSNALTSIDGNFNVLSTKIDSNQESAEEKFLNIDAVLDNVGSSITSINTEISSIKSDLSSATSSISELSDRLTNTNIEVETLKGNIDSTNNNVEDLTEKVEKLQNDVNNQATSLATVSGELAGIVNRLVTLENNISVLESDSNSKFSSITSSIGSLQSKVEEIYDRIVK